jgi:hypothetical protein
MPTEKDVKTLQLTMKEYEAKDDWQLYLWKETLEPSSSQSPHDGETGSHSNAEFLILDSLFLQSPLFQFAEMSKQQVFAKNVKG